MKLKKHTDPKHPGAYAGRMSDQFPASRKMTSRLACPHCQYDQSGAFAALSESLPVTGVCSECGKEFVWLDVTQPWRRALSHFVEYSSGFWKTVLAAHLTMLRALRPRSFWRSVGHAELVVPIRWPVWVLSIILPPALISLFFLALGGMARYVEAYGWINLTDPPLGQWFRAAVEAASELFWSSGHDGAGSLLQYFVTSATVSVFLTALLASIVSVAYARVLRRSSLSRWQGFRIIIYSFAPALALWMIRVLLTYVHIGSDDLSRWLIILLFAAGAPGLIAFHIGIWLLTSLASVVWLTRWWRAAFTAVLPEEHHSVTRRVVVVQCVVNVAASLIIAAAALPKLVERFDF